MTGRLFAALFVVACGHSARVSPPQQPVAHTPDAAVDAPGKPLDEDLARLAQRAVKMQQDLLAALESTGTNCAAAAAKINAIADANTDVTAANAKIAHAGHDRIKQLRDALAPYEADLDKSAHGIADAITASNCAGDAAFSRAFDRFAEGA